MTAAPTPLCEPLLPHPADEETGALVGHQLSEWQNQVSTVHAQTGCVCISAQGPSSPARLNSQVSPAPSPLKVVMVASEGAGPGVPLWETPPSLTLSLAPWGLPCPPPQWEEEEKLGVVLFT